MRGGTKMKYNILFKSYYKFKQYCEDLAFNCCQFNCPIGRLPCPHDTKISCEDITVEHWKNVFQEVKE